MSVDLQSQHDRLTIRMPEMVVIHVSRTHTKTEEYSGSSGVLRDNKRIPQPHRRTRCLKIPALAVELRGISFPRTAKELLMFWFRYCNIFAMGRMKKREPWFGTPLAGGCWIQATIRAYAVQGQHLLAM